MGITFERKVNYYETDRMGVVHHSNYIRFLEEARCSWLEQIGMSYSLLEENGITIPVLGVNCTYKQHVTFEDTIQIHTFVKEYNGKREEYFNTNQEFLEKSNPIYEEFEGNFGDISKCKKYEELPLNAKKYIERIEELTNTKIKFIGTGAGREEIIVR